MVNVHVLGMSHIDLGFTMTEQELCELLEIFAERMVNVLDKNPEVNYSIEQMYHYKGLKQRRPKLFEKIYKYVQDGRIEVMGAMASSMETNFPNGECFVRNQSLGLKWARENFNITPKTAWLVDTFGLNAQIPQVLSQFGFVDLFANRFGGDKRYGVFRSKGIDGSTIVVIGKDCASINVLHDYLSFELIRNWGMTDKLFEHADTLTGDGPRLVTNYIENEEVISIHYVDKVKERQDRVNENWKLSTYRDYIDELRENSESLPVLHGDLNPEFTATFTLRSPIKVKNRAIETKLLEAEKWSVISGTAFDFENCWWKMAFNQFHDVFTGSHSDETFRNVMEKYNYVNTACDEALEKSLDKLTQEKNNSLTLVNGLPFERNEWVKLPKSVAAFKDGKGLKTVVRDGEAFANVTLPAIGMVSVDLGKNISEATQKTDNYYIKNEYFKLEIENDGCYSLYLSDGTPVIENAEDYLIAQEDVGGFQIESPKDGELFASAGKVTVSPAIKDEMGEKITVSGEFPKMGWNNGENTLKWSIDYSLNYNENMLYVKVFLDWYGEGTRVRLNIPTLVNSAEATYEIPFGIVNRTSYRPLPTAKGEWPAHRFVAFEDGNTGIALLNKGIAGVELCGKTLSTTLLRAYSPGPMAWVPPTKLTSRHGESTYEFAIIPYNGSFKKAGVVKKAQQYNNPVMLLDNVKAKDETPFVAVANENIVLSSVKYADDNSDDMVVRLYETYGEETDGTIYIKGLKGAMESDVTEAAKQPILCDGEKLCVSFKPFEIKTIRVKRG